MSKFVYVTGPNTANTDSDVKIAVKVADALLDFGLKPFVTNLRRFWDISLAARDTDAMCYDLGWLQKCDAVLDISGYTKVVSFRSKWFGSMCIAASRDRKPESVELSVAKSAGIPVFEDISELVEWADCDNGPARHLSYRCSQPVKYVYVAGPYSQGDTKANLRAALEASNSALAANLVPYVPHLSYYWHAISPKPYDAWCKFDMMWLQKCDALIRLPGESRGADAEVAEAKRLGIPVVESVEALAELTSPFSPGHVYARCMGSSWAEHQVERDPYDAVNDDGDSVEPVGQGSDLE